LFNLCSINRLFKGQKMKTTRREFLAYGSAFALANSVPSLAFAQSKPLFESMNMFIPAAPGGGWDSTGRAIEMAAKDAGLVGSFQFENVGGAGGMVGLPRFVNQRKGQANALMVGGSVMVGAAITNKSPITMSDVTPIACLTEEAGIIVVPVDGKIKTWKDFEEAIKANPKAVSVAGGSAGGTDHQLLGLVIKALGKNPRDAAYVAFAGGGPANAAILGGQVTAGISGYSEFAEQIKAGKMKALAVSGNKRIPGVDVPTLKELGVNVTAANWRGIFGAPGINAAQKAALVDLATKMHDTKGWLETLEKRKWTDAFVSGAAFEAQIKKYIAETDTVLKELGLA
jgi:putative tricarboxylic transport membrane protein